MARNIVKSYNSIVATSDSTVAFSTADQTLLLHKITQGLEYSIGYERQASKQIGSQELSTNDIFWAGGWTFVTFFFVILFLRKKKQKTPIT